MSSEVTDAEKYGYGTIAIVIVSLLGLLGIVVLPCFKKQFYDKLLIILTGLAIGTLFCDVMLHILPEILGLEEEESETITVPNHVIRLVIAIITLYALWLFEIIVSKSAGGHGHSHGHGHNHSMTQVQPLQNMENKIKTERDEISTIVIPTNNNKTEENTSAETSNNCCASLKRIKPVAWMLIASDFFHNLCDGLAIGASFSSSVSLGIATTIAVVCHEIPHEIADYAVYVQCGFKHWQALLINFGTTITCFIGFYIGASIPSDTDATSWILAFTAGMFLYIALTDLLPTLPFSTTTDWNWGLFILVNLSMILGFTIMFLLVIFEGQIKV